MSERPSPSRKTRAGGAKKRPTRYGLGPSSDPPGLAEALRAHRAGRHAEAIAGYRAVLSGHPGCVDAWMNLGTALVTAGLARPASEAFSEALLLAGNDARAQRDAGIGLSSVGLFRPARRALEASVALDPSLTGARLSLARLCAEMGDAGAAVEHARQAVLAAPSEAAAHLELFRALFDERDLAPCIEAARRAVGLDPGYALARYFLAGALFHDGRGAEAREALGPEGLVDPGLVDALSYSAGRRPPLPCFSSKQATLRFALERARLEGEVIELGVRHGVSTRVLASGSTRVHGFDSFAGLPGAWQDKGPGAFSTGGEPPELPANVTLHVGLFDETLPGFVNESRAPARLIHVDSDLYESALTALVALAPLIGPGCVLVLDEYLGNGSWRDDEHRALAEAAARFGWSIDELSLGWITGQGVVQIGEPTKGVDGWQQRR